MKLRGAISPGASATSGITGNAFRAVRCQSLTVSRSPRVRSAGGPAGSTGGPPASAEIANTAAPPVEMRPPRFVLHNPAASTAGCVSLSAGAAAS